MAADMRVTQVVNERKGVHLMMPKNVVKSIKDMPPGPKHRGHGNEFINPNSHDEL